MKRKEISRKFYIQLPIIIGIIGLLIVVFLKVGENLKKERNTKIITEATLIDVVDIAELSTAEFIYNGIAEIPKKEHSNEILCRVRYKAKVKASINMEDIKFDIDDKKKKITPILPKIKITPIPRMIIAVLKLFVPTNPTIGKSGSIIPAIQKIPSFFFCEFVIRNVRNKITAAFANSDG